ncbi:MAG: hypothetical protein ACLQHS_19385 [Candidatus Limnocylindrales bacterium]
MTRFRDRAGAATGIAPRTLQDIVAVSKWAPDLMPALDEQRMAVTVAAGDARLRPSRAVIEVAPNRERYSMGNLPEPLQRDVRECAGRGEPFLAMRDDARYCSAGCRQWAYRQRKVDRP